MVVKFNASVYDSLSYDYKTNVKLTMLAFVPVVFELWTVKPLYSYHGAGLKTKILKCT